MRPVHPNRSFRMTRPALICSILILLSLATVAIAEDAENNSMRQVRAALKILRRGFKSDDPEERLKALAGLDQHPHALVAEEICKKALPDADLAVRELGARILGRMKDCGEVSGPHLKLHLGKNGKHPEVQVAIVRAIRQLKYRDARRELTDALSHCREQEYQFVTKEVIRTIVELDDKSLVLSLLALAKVKGKNLARPDAPPAEEWHGEATKAGNEARAKANYERKHGTGRAKPKGKAQIITVYWSRELKQAVKTMTGQTFEEPREFEKWLKVHARDFGLKKRDFRKIPKL